MPVVSSSPPRNKRRIEKDIIALIEHGYQVYFHRDGTEKEGPSFSVKFFGPDDSNYRGGIWYVKVDLPLEYPMKSPSIGFTNRIYHPNIDELSGTVCLDVLNQSWTSIYDLTNVFGSFLPQLLLYPNPIDPLNGDAANLFMNQPEKYSKKVKEYVDTYASSSANLAIKGNDSDAESVLSSVHSQEEMDIC